MSISSFGLSEKIVKGRQFSACTLLKTDVPVFTHTHTKHIRLGRPVLKTMHTRSHKKSQSSFGLSEKIKTWKKNKRIVRLKA